MATDIDPDARPDPPDVRTRRLVLRWMAVADAIVTLMAVITLVIVLTVGEPNTHNWLLFFNFIQAFLWLLVLIVVGIGKHPCWFTVLIGVLIASLALDFMALAFRTAFLALGQGESDVLLQDVFFEILVAIWVILDFAMAITAYLLSRAVIRKLGLVKWESSGADPYGAYGTDHPAATATAILQERINGGPTSPQAYWTRNSAPGYRRGGTFTTANGIKF